MKQLRFERAVAQRPQASGRDAQKALSVAPPDYSIDLADRGPAAATGAPVLRRMCAGCAEEEERKVIRRSPNGARGDAATSNDLLDYLSASSGRGAALAPDVRSSFERSLGTGLGSVRVVHDSASAQAANTLGARAFTLGSTIWFGRNEYRPSTPSGRRLLAHEVAHAVQQRSASPSIQREVVVGDARDPAEATADRVADAIMRGEPASPPSEAGRTVLRRTCTAKNVPDKEQIIATCDGTRWLVTHRRETPRPDSRVPDTQIDGDIQVGYQQVRISGWLCRGGTSVVLEASANLVPAAMGAIWDLVNRRPVGTTTPIQPQVAVIITRDGTWRLTLAGRTSVGAGGMQSAGGGITFETRSFGPFSLDVIYIPPMGSLPPAWGGGATIPMPERRQNTIPRVNCSRARDPEPQDVFDCQRIHDPTPDTPAIPEMQQTPTTTIYALFRYETAQLTHWIFDSDRSREYVANDPAVRQRITELVLAHGFRPSRITARTSPEGLRNLPVAAPSGFRGNDPLSQARARAAYDAFVNDLCFGCPTFGNVPITTVAAPQINPELYSPEPVNGREVEGADLDREAVPAFAAVDRLGPTDQVAFARMTAAQRREWAYRRLRRAEILLERSPIRAPGHPGVRGRPGGPGAIETCPAEIQANAPQWFLLHIRRPSPRP